MAAIVTGGASGLGGATAARLAREGVRVTIFDLNAQLAAAKAKEIGGDRIGDWAGRDVAWHGADFSELCGDRHAGQGDRA